MIEIPTGEQIFASMQKAQAEVEAMCGGNWHLVEDHVIGTVTEFSANGRHTFVHDVRTGHAPIEAGGYARILPACRAFSARRVQEPDMDRASVWTMCDRCGDQYNSRDGRRLLVPAGQAAVEFVVCPGCVDYLDRDFGPVTWAA